MNTEYPKRIVTKFPNGRDRVYYLSLCGICGDEFQTKYRALCCSEKCIQEREKIKTSRKNLNKSISPSTKGQIAEVLVCVDLFEKGFDVFKAFSPACYCDLIATKAGMVYKIEVKTGYFNTSTKRYSYPKSNKDFDVYAVYDGTSKEIFYSSKGGNILLL